MSMPFEKVSSGSSVGMKISVRKSASIGLNEAVLQEYFSDAEYVEIYYDEDENQIGMRAVDEKTADAYTISEQRSGATVAPTAFLKQKQLIPDVTTRYEPFVQKLNDDVDLVVIDLDNPIDTYGTPDANEDSKKANTTKK